MCIRDRLELSELVVSVLVADLASLPLQDIGIPLMNGLVSILTLFCLELILSGVTLRSQKLRAALFGKPCFLIEKGTINQKEMHRCRFSVDELTEELRRHLSSLRLMARDKGRALEVDPITAGSLDKVLEGMDVEADEAWTASRERMQEAFASSPQVPSLLRAELRDYQKEAVRRAKAFGYAETLFHRRRYLPELNVPALRAFGERVALNMPIQGTAADMIKIAMIHVDKLLEGTRSRLILQIHDELLVDLHKDETELIPKIEEAMIGALPLPNGVPILVEARTGNNWLEAH